MVRPLTVVFLGLSVALVLPQPGFACSCATDDPRELVALAGVVARGQVVEVEALPRWRQALPCHWDNPRRTHAHIRVETVWKGTAKTELVVEGGDGGPDCSVRFTRGVDYLVFGQDRGEGTLSTDACAGTISADHAIDVADLLAALGPGTTVAVPTVALPASGEAAGYRWPLVLAGVAGLTALATGLSWRRFGGRPRV